MLHMKNCIQQIYFRLKQTSERNALMQKKISSLLYCVLKSIIMHLTYLFDNKLMNVVNISFKLKNNDGTPYTLVLTAVFWCRLNSFRLVFCLIVWKSLKWNQKKKMWKKDVVMRLSINVYARVQKFYFFNFETRHREMIR